MFINGNNLKDIVLYDYKTSCLANKIFTIKAKGTFADLVVDITCQAWVRGDERTEIRRLDRLYFKYTPETYK